MAEQELTGPEVAGLLVNERNLRPPEAVGSVTSIKVASLCKLPVYALRISSAPLAVIGSKANKETY